MFAGTRSVSQSTAVCFFASSCVTTSKLRLSHNICRKRGVRGVFVMPCYAYYQVASVVCYAVLCHGRVRACNVCIQRVPWYVVVRPGYILLSRLPFQYLSKLTEWFRSRAPDEIREKRFPSRGKNKAWALDTRHTALNGDIKPAWTLMCTSNGNYISDHSGTCVKNVSCVSTCDLCGTALEHKSHNGKRRI